MLLTVTGRTSDRTYTFPVRYVEREGEILVLAGRAATKSWWRNLREPAPVGMRLRGRDVAGMALAVVDPAGVAEGLRDFARRFPRSAKAMVGPSPAVSPTLPRSPEPLSTTWWSGSGSADEFTRRGTKVLSSSMQACSNARSLLIDAAETGTYGRCSSGCCWRV